MSCVLRARRAQRLWPVVLLCAVSIVWCRAAARAEGGASIGQMIGDFTLTDLQGKAHTLSQYRGKIVLLDFWSATCPFSARYEERLKAIATEYASQGVVTLAIDANKTEPLELVQRVAAERRVPFPILIDPGNRIADQLGGLTTPHVFLLDAQRRLVYQGAIDDEGLRPKPVTHRYLRDALDALLAGRAVTTSRTEPIGCSIKRVQP